MRYPNLDAELARQGITQKKLAEYLHASEATINQRLSGKIAFPIDQIRKICPLLKLPDTVESIDYLMVTKDEISC